MKPAPINPHVALLKVVLSGRNDVDAVIAGMVRRRRARLAFQRQVEAWRLLPMKEFHNRLMQRIGDGLGLSRDTAERMLE